MKKLVIVLAVALIAAPGIASAGLVPSLIGAPVACGAGCFTYNYSVTLQSDQRLGGTPSIPVSDHFFTIYDFRGFIAGSNAQPAGWIFSSALIGKTPSTVLPPDSGAEPNLTWTWGGVTPPPGTGGTVALGTFSANSSIGNLITTGRFASEATNNTGGPQDGSSIQNVGFTSVPEPAPRVPGPPTLLLLGATLAGLGGIAWRRTGRK